MSAETFRNTVTQMENKLDAPTIIAAIFVAGYAAIMLEHIADSDFGCSTGQIRQFAMIAATMIGMLVATDLLRANPDDAE
jgi:hypothetical protein